MHFGKGFNQDVSYSIDGGRLALLPHGSGAKPYDLDLLYVECRACGKPLVWEPGRTPALIAASGIDLGLFDEQCLLLSDGCPACLPGAPHFTLHLVRLTSLSAPELLLLGACRGHA